MRLVGGCKESAVKSAKKSPHSRRFTAYYSIHGDPKILLPLSLFAVLRQFLPILPISTSARGESENQAGFSKRIIAGNRHLHAVNRISAGI